MKIFVQENLIYLKKKSNMTWDEIAIKVGIPYRTLQDIVYKQTNYPNIKSIILLAKFYHLTLDDLVLKDLSK